MKFETKTVHEVDYREFEDYVAHVYKRHDFSFLDDHDALNDSYYKFDVKCEEFHEWELGKLDDFNAQKKEICISAILLKDMCVRGLIPPGTYLIKVSW